jgi:23S rRNA (uracil1939-C5)-methyltransferase
MTEETLSLEILDVVYRGKGLARHEGCVVFVPGVLPGETVTARIRKQHKSYADAVLVSIEKKSPARIEPACPLSEQCPGCSYQHMEYTEELRLKQAQFKDMLKRQGGTDPSTCLDPTASPTETGYRNKIILHAQKDKKTGKMSLGYFGKNNRTVFDIPQCPLALPAINKLIKEKLSDTIFMRSLKDGDKVTFRYTENDKALCWAGKSEPGKGRLIETTEIGTFKVHTRSFFQVNSAISDKMTKCVTDIIMLNKPETLIDLYCGVGVMAIAAAEAGVPAVLGIDYDRSAVRCASQNARQRELQNVEFMGEAAGLGLELAFKPLDVSNCTLILDPPRRGLEKEVIDAIARKPPSRIIYVSCAADTLARDISRLAEFGYKVNRTQIFDMFPRTPHFESVTLLTLS